MPWRIRALGRKYLAKSTRGILESRLFGQKYMNSGGDLLLGPMEGLVLSIQLYSCQDFLSVPDLSAS